MIDEGGKLVNKMELEIEGEACYELSVKFQSKPSKEKCSNFSRSPLILTYKDNPEEVCSNCCSDTDIQTHTDSLVVVDTCSRLV
jgi:hypothetical protein